MHKRSALWLLSIIAAVLVAVVGGSAARAGNTLCVNTDGSNSCYTSIQTAVNAASSGDTINVAAGTYAEDVTVNKALTLNGAQAGNDASSRSGSESTAKSISISTSSVTIDGFTFNGSAAQVDINSSTTLSGIVVQNDIFNGYSSTGLTSYDGGNLLVKQNLFENPSGSGEAMQIRASTVQGGCDDSSVQYNTFDSATNNGGADVNFSCTGSDSSGIDVAHNTSTGTSGGSSFLGLSGVTDLTTSNNTATTDGSSVYVFGDITGTWTSTNDSFTSTTGKGVSVHADDSGTSDPVNSGTIDLEGDTLSGSPALGVATGAVNAGSVIKLRSSKLTGSIQNAESATMTVDASANWWGSTSGPGTVTGVSTTPWCTRTDCSIKSDDADLMSLSLSSGTLSPSFGSSITSYTASVDNDTTNITANYTAVSGASASTSGGSSLTVGDNTVEVTVTSADSTTTKVYTITVNRAAAPSSGGSSGSSGGGGTTTTSTTTTTSSSPPAPNQPQSTSATPDQSGSVAATVASSSGSLVAVTVSWPAGAFSAPELVTVAPQNPTATATLSGGFDFGSAIVQLTVASGSGQAVHQFGAPLVLHISSFKAKQIPAYSEDGKTWKTIPRLSSPELPAGQQDGYYVNADGSVDIYTRHATYFGILADAQAPTTPTLHARVTSKYLRMALTGASDNVRVIRYVVNRNGHGYRLTVHPYLALPLRPGRYFAVAVDAAGNVSDHSVTITVVATHNKHHPFAIVKG